MSAEELSKLSLGDTMVTTRAGAARARTAPPQNPPPNVPESPSSSAPSPTSSVIEASNGLQYDVSAFDDDLRRRAKRGLIKSDNEIKMKFCKTIEDEPPRYDFHLDDEITVVMGGRSGNSPKCTCGANESGRACKHIFWMLGQLASKMSERVRSEKLELAEDGSAVHNLRPAELIERVGLENVADKFGWFYQEDPEEDDMVEEITNMLSVFEPAEALATEFKNEETKDLSERSRKYLEFKGLFTQHATRNPAMFMDLQDIISPEFQAHVFFEKINHRIDKAFQALHEYIANGPTNAPPEAHDVKTCARKLLALDDAISEHYQEQDEDSEDAKDVAVRTAAALIKMLLAVTDRNFDAYEGVTWGDVWPDDPKENNLFVCLIGARSTGDRLFVLDTLRHLPHGDVLRNHWEDLSLIEEKLMGPWTPDRYMDAFRALTQESRKRAASDIGGSSSKRPMP